MVSAPETFTTKGDATAWLAQAQTDQARGQFIDPRAGRITLSAFADRFLTERVLAERTAETYRGLLDNHIRPTLGNIEMGQLAPGTVRAWHARLARRHPSTAAKAYRLLRTICNTAVLDEVIARSPCRVEGAGIERAEERPIATLEVESRVVVYEASVSTNISSTFVDRLYQINVSVTISVNRGDGKYLLSGV